MGQYINVINGKFIGTSFNEKCNALVKAGAKETNGQEFKPDMICVVDNGHFAAAGYAHNNSEHKIFKTPDGRPKRWFTLENAKSYID